MGRSKWPLVNRPANSFAPVGKLFGLGGRGFEMLDGKNDAAADADEPSAQHDVSVAIANPADVGPSANLEF